MMAEMISTRVAFGEALRDLARAGYDVVAVTADTSKSMCVDLLAQEFPERWVDTGVAEQNMMMIAAGLAAAGKIVFASSYSVFTSMRCCEQLRTFVAYPFLNVKVAAGLGGLTAGIEGVTHVAMEDLGIVRCIPNMTILNPADATTTRMSVKAAADWPGPVYIRLGRDASPVLFDHNYQFQIGKAVHHREGDDVALVASGLILGEALEASDLLTREGIGVYLLEMHTLKPLDKEKLLEIAQRTKAVVTVEEHSIVGGLGSAVAEVLSENYPVIMERVGIKDIFAESGTPEELRQKFGLTSQNIVETVKRVLKKRGC